MGTVRHSAYLDEITEDCWRRAGIGAGWRVLDAGCATGESTLLAARMVGLSGTVVGWESDHAAVRVARAAADQQWVENVEFREGDIGSLAWLGEAPFDAVVGSGFLVRQSDPVIAMRTLSRLVRPGGVLAFVEEELEYGYRLEPALPLLSQAVDRLQLGARELGQQLHVVSNFPKMFLEAGLGWPTVRAYQAAWGPDSAIWRRVAEGVAETTTVRRKREELDPVVLEEQLAAAAHEHGGAWVSAPMAGAWARVSG